jgi:hypothetical protein
MAFQMYVNMERAEIEGKHYALGWNDALKEAVRLLHDLDEEMTWRAAIQLEKLYKEVKT